MSEGVAGLFIAYILLTYGMSATQRYYVDRVITGLIVFVGALCVLQACYSSLPKWKNVWKHDDSSDEEEDESV